MTKRNLFLVFFLMTSFLANPFSVDAQIQEGVWRTPTNNTNYHHFTRYSGGAAVYINKESIGGSILTLSSGTMDANQGVKFTVAGNGNVTAAGSFRTGSTNTDYSHIIRDGGGAAVYINQVSNNVPILTLSSGTSDANQGVKFTVEGDGSVTSNGSITVAGSFKNGSTNTGYSHFVRNGGNAGGAAVYINQVSDNGSILTLSSGTSVANQGVKFTVEGDGTTVTKFLKVGTANIPANYIAGFDGKIITEEVRVKPSAHWPDYVFASDYDLLPIQDLEEYITENQHLPNVPSAEEIETQGGADLGAMNVVLLEKVEELTLYIIQMNEKIEALNQEVETLNEQIEK